MIILATIILYFALLTLYSRAVSRRARNASFFRADRQSRWYLVAFGMIGASISGVSFVSVPGMVSAIGMTYMQTCLGFIAGYIVVAFVLLPVYYRLNLTSIYGALLSSGRQASITGACFFFLSELTGAAVKFFVVCAVLQRFVLEKTGIPFPVTVVLLVLPIWLYTRRGGIKTLVRTDGIQTACMLAALCVIIFKAVGALDMSLPEAFRAVCADSRARWFVFDDAFSTQYFWKQFLSGAFIVIVMTGLNQNVMQKNLTCKTLGEAQKDMCSYGAAFVPVNLLFLSLGVLLALLCEKEGLPVPSGDNLLESFAATGRLGRLATVCFTLGIVAASASTADSALTSLTTSFCVDICGKEDDERLRKRAHLAITILFAAVIIAVGAVKTTSVIDTIYTLCGYTYGPLLGMFAFALFTRRRPRACLLPFIAAASPVLCYLINMLCEKFAGYRFGYELLILNGLLTFAGLLLTSARRRL
ncbi:MAG: sodium:solute symporter [Prevotella sp.]|nr:sodium:solute symporter [Prevotella sp.]